MSTGTVPKILFLTAVSLLILGISLIFVYFRTLKNTLVSPVADSVIKIERTLDRYAFNNLSLANFTGNEMEIGEEIRPSGNFTSRLLFFNSEGKKTSALVNIPLKQRPKSVILLLRGFVDKEVYQSGMGTSRIGEHLADSGFLTISPDFLGYGQSASPSANPMEERFQTYTTVLQLLESLPLLPQAVKNALPEYPYTVDPSSIGLFGHSNGGHIALAVLEITGASYPTVLWAPVSKPFPYSILYYTDEFSDKGYALRKLVSDFESFYQSSKYSIDNYFDNINAPIELHQGESDEEVPIWWSNELYEMLKEKNKKIDYFTYPGENHNFNKGSWNTLAFRTLNFYNRLFP